MIRWLSKQELQTTVGYAIREAKVVLDIGCGIRPQQFVKPLVSVYIEAYDEYLGILSKNLTGTRSVIIQGIAQDVLKWLPDRSIDSIFLLDFIEHVEKSDGKEILAHCERIARKQVVLFTPLGFMAQEYSDDDTDGWGLTGTQWQVHKSGWDAQDFDDTWDIYACEKFHFVNSKDEPLDEPHGAFFAIKNIREYSEPENEPIPETRSTETGGSSGLIAPAQNADNLSRLLIQEIYTRMGKWEANLVEKEDQLKRFEFQVEHKAAQLYAREIDFDKRTESFNQELIRKEMDFSERATNFSNSMIERNEQYHQIEKNLQEREERITALEQDFQKRVDAFNENRLEQEKDFARRVTEFERTMAEKVKDSEDQQTLLRQRVAQYEQQLDELNSRTETNDSKKGWLQAMKDWLNTYGKGQR